jgi:hypothetical protein
MKMVYEQNPYLTENTSATISEIKRVVNIV